MAMDIAKICRTCLQLNGPLLSIYDGGGGGGCIADMLRDFTKTHPRREDKLPEKVCLSCISEINRCYSFKLKCENSSRTLRQLLPDALPEEVIEVESKVRVTQTHKSIQTKPEVVKLVATVSTQTKECVELKRTHQHVQTIPMRPITHDKSTSPIMVEQVVCKTNSYEKVKVERNTPLETDSEIEIVESERMLHRNNLRHALSLKRRRIEEETEVNGTVFVMGFHSDEAEISETAEGISLYSAIPEEPEETNENTTTYYNLSNSQPEHGNDTGAPSNDNNLNESNQEKNDVEFDEERVYAQFVYADETQEYNEADGDTQTGDYSFMVYKNDNGEAEIVTHLNSITTRSGKARQVKKKRTTIKEELKCAHCAMTFVSAKRLARHELKRHGIEYTQNESEVNKKPESRRSTTTVNTYKAKTSDEDNSKIIDYTESNAPTNETGISTSQPIVQKTKPADLKFFCDKCGAGFALRRSLIHHKKQDLCNKVTYNCEICVRAFISEETLKEHKTTHLQEHECTVCAKFFATNDDLSQHMVVEHKRNLRNQCPLCKKVFTILSALKDHLRVHSGEKPFVCDICNKGFSQKTNLKQHVMRHSKEKKFNCDDCSMSFVTKGELWSHKRTHTGEHPYRCDECHATFTISSSLVKHKRIHTGERPYACDLCPKRFTSSFTLKNHRRMHTGERPYQCRWCGKTFTQKQDCVIHHRTHTGERKHTCHCGVKFTHLGTLRSHMKTHDADDTDTVPKVVDRAKRRSTQRKESADFNITIIDADDDDEEADADNETATVVTVIRENMECLTADNEFEDNDGGDADVVNEEKLMQLAIEKA